MSMIRSIFTWRKHFQTKLHKDIKKNLRKEEKWHRRSQAGITYRRKQTRQNAVHGARWPQMEPRVFTQEAEQRQIATDGVNSQKLDNAVILLHNGHWPTLGPRSLAIIPVEGWPLWRGTCIAYVQMTITDQNQRKVATLQSH